MSDFKQKIIADINWRTAEIATTKSIPFRYNVTDEHRAFLIKHSIPIIYSFWEGYVKNCIEIYARELNSVGLSLNQFSPQIITNSIEIQFPQVNEAINNYAQTIKFVSNLLSYVDRVFKVLPKVPTTNNINLKTLNNILERFAIRPLKGQHLEAGLHKLLKYRNAIAHGDNSVKVEKELISEFSDLVYELMYEVFVSIETSYTMKTFRGTRMLELKDRST